MNIRTVHLFVFDTMADWEAAHALAAVNNPRFQTAQSRYRVVLAAVTLDPIITMSGARIQPEVKLSSIEPESSALLVLPGGRAWESDNHSEALELAARFIASACR